MIKEYLKAVYFIFRKDIQSEFRSRETITLWVSFSALVFTVFAASINLSIEVPEEVAPSFLWVSFAILASIGLNASFKTEKEQGGWKGILMSPIDHSAIFLGKFLSNIIFAILAETPALIGFVFFFGWPNDIIGFSTAILLGILGFVSLGTLLAAFVVHNQSRDLLLPIMLLPPSLPIITLSSQLMAGANAGTLTSAWWIVIIFLIGYDLIAIFGSAFAFSQITELY